MDLVDPLLRRRRGLIRFESCHFENSLDDATNIHGIYVEANAQQTTLMPLWDDEAFNRAWRMVTDANPFPATLGRICPHPCEAGCNRAGKDGAVAINALERFLGDHARVRYRFSTDSEGHRRTLPAVDAERAVLVVDEDRG